MHCWKKENNKKNKANLRDLIAATGLVILLKLDANRWFFSTCDLEIWWMTSQNNRTPLLYYVKLCASFQIHRWIQTGVTVRKCSIRVKIGDFLSRVTLKFNGWPWKTIGNLFYATLSFVTISKPSVYSYLSYSPEMLNSGQNRVFCLSRVTLKLDGWTWKPIGYFFYAASSSVYHLKAISEFKLKLQSGNTQFGSISMIFCPVWPWNLTDDLEKQ